MREGGRKGGWEGGREGRRRRRRKRRKMRQTNISDNVMNMLRMQRGEIVVRTVKATSSDKKYDRRRNNSNQWIKPVEN